MYSLIELCILNIGKSQAENIAEILSIVIGISPDFEKKVHRLLDEKILINMLGEKKEWYKSGELSVHKKQLEDTTKCTIFFKNGKIYQMYTTCNGKIVGKYEEFYPTGKIYEERFFENDTAYKYTRWQANGYKLRSWAKINDEDLYSEENYHKNGRLASLNFGYWRNSMISKKHGEQFYWDKNGTLNRNENWEFGHKINI